MIYGLFLGIPGTDFFYDVAHSQIQHYTRPYCVFREIIQSWLLLRKCVSGVSNEWWTTAAGGKYMIRNGIVSNSKLHESRDQSTIDLPTHLLHCFLLLNVRQLPGDQRALSSRQTSQWLLGQVLT